MSSRSGGPEGIHIGFDTIPAPGDPRLEAVPLESLRSAINYADLLAVASEIAAKRQVKHEVELAQELLEDEEDSYPSVSDEYDW